MDSRKNYTKHNHTHTQTMESDTRTENANLSDDDWTILTANNSTDSKSDQHSSHSEDNLNIDGFQPLDESSEDNADSNLDEENTRNNDEIEETESSSATSRSSSESSLNSGFVELKYSSIEESSTGEQTPLHPSAQTNSSRDERFETFGRDETSLPIITREPPRHSLIQERLDELSILTRQSPDASTLNYIISNLKQVAGDLLNIALIVPVISFLALAFLGLYTAPIDKMEKNVEKSSSQSTFNLELSNLNDEIGKCIKRQSKFSQEHYPGPVAKFIDEKTKNEYKSDEVCFGQEKFWKQRLSEVFSSTGIDFQSLLYKSRVDAASNWMRNEYPRTNLKYLFNQMEYLDFLENWRNKKYLEENVKYLKAQNMQLIHQLNKPKKSRDDLRKNFIDLELENLKLKRENIALKSSLMEKAGPAFIKQSIELEATQRKLTMLKEFHDFVIKNVFKALQQFNLRLVDHTTHIDDSDETILSAQIELTKGYLKRLNEKLGNLLADNVVLKEELQEFRTNYQPYYNPIVLTYRSSSSDSNDYGSYSTIDSFVPAEDIAHVKPNSDLARVGKEVVNDSRRNQIHSPDDCYKELVTFNPKKSSRVQRTQAKAITHDG